MLKNLTRLLKHFWIRILEYEFYTFLVLRNTVWKYTNIYPTATIGRNNSIGSYTEIGDGVKIGNDNRIGAHSFIPARVIIKNNCFIGPCVCFTNDRYPPSGEENWEMTVVDDNASIGAGCVILPGILIGEGALIGAGSVVTHSVPRGETWAGIPAKLLKSRRRLGDAK